MPLPLFISPLATSAPPNPPTPPPSTLSTTPPWLLHVPQNSPHILPITPTPKTPNPKSMGPPLTSGIPGGRTHRNVLSIIRSIRSLQIARKPNNNPVTQFELNLDIPLAPESDDNDEKKVRTRAPPWKAADREEDVKVLFRREKKAKEMTRAEVELEKDELERLRRMASWVRKEWVKAKKAGVTEEVVEEVRKVWRERELAAVKVVEPLRRCMDRAMEIVEVNSTKWHLFFSKATPPMTSELWSGGWG